MTELTVWKYELSPRSVQHIGMPQDAKLLSVHVQDDTPCLWALVDPTKEKVARRIVLAGTGQYVDAELTGEHVGTFLLAKGSYVGHIFDAGEHELDEVGGVAVVMGLSLNGNGGS